MEKGKGLYPGCLAMTVGLSECPHNGWTVTCVQKIEALAWVPGEPYRAAISGWLVHSEELITSELRDPVTCRPMGELRSHTAVFPARNLLPLGGPGIVTDETKEKEVPKKEDVY